MSNVAPAAQTVLTHFELTLPLIRRYDLYMAEENGRKRQTTKKCHWVPQAYLRAFSADPRRLKVWRFSRHETGCDPELKSIDKVAVRFYLYAPKYPKTGIPDDSMERKLSSLEKYLGDPVWRALCNDLPDYSWEPIRKRTSLLVATMMLRNPAHFDRFKKLHHKLVAAITATDSVPENFKHGDQTYTLDSASWPAFQNASEHDIQVAWLEELGSAAWYAEELLKMRWTILCAEKPTFITSDNPVTIVHPSLEFRGLSNPETKVIFPISPTRILIMDNIHGAPANTYRQLDDDGSAVNYLVWCGANEHMFSARDPDEVCRDFLLAAKRPLSATKY